MVVTDSRVNIALSPTLLAPNLRLRCLRKPYPAKAQRDIHFTSATLSSLCHYALNNSKCLRTAKTTTPCCCSSLVKRLPSQGSSKNVLGGLRCTNITCQRRAGTSQASPAAHLVQPLHTSALRWAMLRYPLQGSARILRAMLLHQAKPGTPLQVQASYAAGNRCSGARR